MLKFTPQKYIIKVLFMHAHVIPNYEFLLLLNKREDIIFEERWKPVVEKILWKSMATINCLVTNILQNEGEEISSWVNYHFNLIPKVQ